MKKQILLKHCVRLIIMFIPIVLWDFYIIVKMFYKIEIIVDKTITTTILFLIYMFLFFSYSFIDINLYEEDIMIQKKTADKIEIVINIAKVLLISWMIFSFYSIPFLLFLITQCIFLMYDKNGFTYVEYIENYIKDKRKIEKEKKERMVA